MEAKDYLRQHPQVDSERIGIYGRSKGAELVLAEESIFNDVQCLVLNSPSDVFYEGIKGKWNSTGNPQVKLQTDKEGNTLIQATCQHGQPQEITLKPVSQTE